MIDSRNFTISLKKSICFYYGIVHGRGRQIEIKYTFLQYLSYCHVNLNITKK